MNPMARYRYRYRYRYRMTGRLRGASIAIAIPMAIAICRWHHRFCRPAQALMSSVGKKAGF
jgi:hypothetical protein